MRTPLLVTLALLATLPLGTAAAHFPHGPCTSTTAAPYLYTVHVDSFAGSCRGVVVSSPLVDCAGGTDLHVTARIHVLVLYDGGCQTGVVVQGIRIDAPEPTLP